MANGIAHWRPAELPALICCSRCGSAPAVLLPARLAGRQDHCQLSGRNELKSYEEIMEILEAFDLTGSCRSAAELAGCSHHTVGHYVMLRDEGRLASPGEPLQSLARQSGATRNPSAETASHAHSVRGTGRRCRLGNDSCGVTRL